MIWKSEIYEETRFLASFDEKSNASYLAPDRPVGSLAEFIAGIELKQVGQQVASGFSQVLRVQLIEWEL